MRECLSHCWSSLPPFWCEWQFWYMLCVCFQAHDSRATSSTSWAQISSSGCMTAKAKCCQGIDSNGSWVEKQWSCDHQPNHNFFKLCNYTVMCQGLKGLAIKGGYCYDCNQLSPTMIHTSILGNPWHDHIRFLPFNSIAMIWVSLMNISMITSCLCHCSFL